jgi:hypothetical protein
MDLPIILRQPVTAGDRMRWLMFTVVGTLACYAVGRTAPWALDRAAEWLPAVSSTWILVGFLLAWWLPGLVAFVSGLHLLFDCDQTWIIDGDVLTVRKDFIVGRWTRTWRLCAITAVRVGLDKGENEPYSVQIQVDGRRWISIRHYDKARDAHAFKRLIEDVLSIVRAEGRCE